MAAQRYSHQRESIYQAVCGRKDHPTAELVYLQLKPELPRLSLGTVYRDLHGMAQAGRLLELDGPAVRFDGNVEPHHHFCCEGCGRVFDLPLPYDPELDRRLAADGWQVKRHSLLFTGLCPACAAQKTKENN